MDNFRIAQARYDRAEAPFAIDDSPPTLREALAVARAFKRAARRVAARGAK